MSQSSLSFNWSTGTIVITSIVSVLLVGCIGVGLYRYATAQPFSLFSGNLATWLIALVVAVWVVPGIPLKLCYGPEGLTVKAIGKTVSLPKADIARISAISYDSLGKTTRKVGSGGFGGWLGLFSSTKIGNYQSFVTDKSVPQLLVETRGGKKYVISCADAHKVVKALEGNRI